MGQENRLARRSNESIVIGGISLKPSEATLAKELDLTAENAKTELSPGLQKEFLRVFSKYPPEAIESAFRGWRDVSPFIPTVSDIRELLAVWKLAHDADVRAEERRNEVLARARGELIDFADIKEMLVKLAEKAGPLPKLDEVAKSMPDVDEHQPPPRDELIRRRNEQLKAVQEKYGVKR